MTDTGILPPLDFTPQPVDDILAVIGNGGFWQRFGVITIGVFLVITGTVIAVSGTRAVKQVGQLAVGVASKVVTKGAV